MGLYSIAQDGELNQYPDEMKFTEGMPSQGDFSNPNDKSSVQGLEDQMIS